MSFFASFLSYSQRNQVSKLYFGLLLIFANRCLIKDFEKRPSVTHLLDHPFIKEAHGKVLFLQKQLAKVLQDQKHLNPVVKTRYDTHPLHVFLLPLSGYL